MEPDIEEIAENALRDAFNETRLAGRDVLVAENDQVLVLSPSGLKTVLHPIRHRRARVVAGSSVRVK